VFHTSVVDLQPRCRNGGILNHWLSTTACPTGKHPGQAHGQRRHLWCLRLSPGVPQVPPGRAAPSPTARLATGPGPYALLNAGPYGCCDEGAPDARTGAYGRPKTVDQLTGHTRGIGVLSFACPTYSSLIVMVSGCLAAAAMQSP